MTAVAGCGCPFRGAKDRRIGLQLYSVNRILWKDPAKLFDQLAAAGYDGVEFYNFNGKTGGELKVLCDASGLEAFGTHLNGDEMLVGDALKKTLDFAAEAGFRSIVTPHAKRDTADEYRKFGHTMGLAAEAADAYGIKVGIHTTYHHFTTLFDGVTAWDMIYREASPKLYQQVDTANTFNTGYDVVGLLKKYPGRHYSLHLKENVPTKDGVFGVPPTNGNPLVPWKEVMEVMKADPSNEWLIVEAEGRPDSVDPAVRCASILRSWL